MTLNRPGMKTRCKTRISLPISIVNGWKRRELARQIGRRLPPAAIAMAA
jgi:hypothetical protein